MSTPFELPKLPYAVDALAPHITENTINFHYGKHHSTYVNKLNGMVGGTDYADMNVETVIKETNGKSDKAGFFNNAAQIWNHTFYWHSMKPKGGGVPSGVLAEKIESSFGGLEGFKSKFTDAATTQFGSGWAWLVAEGDALKIVKTPNAETPLTSPNQIPLLTIDVWEHAYYLDFQNKRPDYINTFLESLINWDFATENLQKTF